MERLILDTTVLINAERAAGAPLDAIGDDDDVAIAAITAAELLVGVELADESRREQRRAFVAAVLEAIPVESYDLDVARTHAALLAHARQTGRPRGTHDLIIAATAANSGRMVLTADGAGFSGLPGVEVRFAA